MPSLDRHGDDMDALERLLARSAALSDTIARSFHETSFDDSARGYAALGMCDIAFEHAASLKLLIANGLPTSGIAMLRLQYEAFGPCRLAVARSWRWPSLASPGAVDARKPAGCQEPSLRQGHARRPFQQRAIGRGAFADTVSRSAGGWPELICTRGHPSAAAQERRLPSGPAVGSDQEFERGVATNRAGADGTSL